MVDLQHIISTIQHSKNTLFIMCGFPYAGKSYVASELQSHTNIQVVAIDDIFKANGFDWDTQVLPSAGEWEQISNESYEKTKFTLQQGKNVLFDSTNQTVSSRNILRDVALSVGADTRIIYVKTPIETVWKRYEENKNTPKRSLVSRELVQQTINMFEEPTADEHVLIIEN